MTALEKLQTGGAFGYPDYFNLFPEIKTVQLFDDKGENPKLAKIFHFTELTETMSRRLKYMNTEGAGVYMAVNATDGKGRRASNVTKIRAVFADLDGAPLEPALGYNPSLVVESSPGRYHVYWFTSDCPINGFTAVQKNIIRTLGGDPAVHDLPRVLRVPGFYHQKKGKPFLSRICGGSGDVFSYKDLVNFFPPLQVPQWSAKRYKLIAKNTYSDAGFHGHYGCAGNGERNNYVLRRIGGMIKAGKNWQYITEEAFKEGFACTPPLPEREIEAILKSAQKYI